MEMNYQRRQDRRAERRQRRADKKAGVDNRTEEQKIQDSTISEGQSLLNALKGGATGAMAGAQMGSFAGGPGSAIGAGVGFIVGFTGGYVEESNQQADLFQQRIDQLKTDQAAAALKEAQKKEGQLLAQQTKGRKGRRDKQQGSQIVATTPNQTGTTRGGGMSTFDDFMGDKFYTGMT